MYFRLVSAAMANASSEVAIPNVIYQEGDRQNFSEELSHVKYNGSMSLNISDFQVWSEVKEEGFVYESLPVEFVFGKKTYKFEFQIDLKTKKDDKIGVFLEKLNPEDVTVTFEMMALDSSGNSFKKSPASKKLSLEEPNWGFPTFLSKKSLKDNAATHLPNGALKLKCDFTIYVAEISQVQSEVQGSVGESTLSINFHNLWTEGVLQDFNIKCEGEDIPCHRAILAARSDMFKAMLTSDSIEKKKGEVEIKDCSAGILRHFLKFVYTDCLDDERDYNSTELLILADRYQVSGLKKRCEVALSKTISKNNAIQLLSTASLYSAELLMANASRVVANNLKELVGSEDWKQMVATNPQAMEAIVKTSL
jgi:speckle-type POZ protein